jgi:hypothetical protein
MAPVRAGTIDMPIAFFINDLTCGNLRNSKALVLWIASYMAPVRAGTIDMPIDLFYYSFNLWPLEG